MRARIRRPGRRTVLLAAALAALLIWGAAALGGDFFRSVSAALVQDLTPIRLSDTDQGIVMSVQSVTEKDGAFHVHIALRDELGDRLREGAALFPGGAAAVREAALSLAVLEDVLPLLEVQEDYDNDALFSCLSAYVKEKGYKTGYVMWPIRTAVSGKQNTPGGATEIMDVLGKEESLKRISDAVVKLEEA